MRSSSMLCVLFATLPLVAARYFPSSDAHQGRVFSVHVSAPGLYDASIHDAGNTTKTIRVNGRHHQGATYPLKLELRRGLNTVALEGGGQSTTIEGLSVVGAVAPADVPSFVTIEAEDADCSGTIIGPTFDSYTDAIHLPTEASNRKACMLKKAGCVSSACTGPPLLLIHFPLH